MRAGVVTSQGRFFMLKEYAGIFEARNFVLTWASELMRFYPWLMRLSHVLHRLVQ